MGIRLWLAWLFQYWAVKITNKFKILQHSDLVLENRFFGVGKCATSFTWCSNVKFVQSKNAVCV